MNFHENSFETAVRKGVEIYIELAILENFLIDGALLWLSLYAAKRKIRLGKIFLSAALGAAFAVFFPFFTLPKAIGTILKFATGALLVYVAIAEKGRGRYAMTVLLFYGFSCAFAGLIFAAAEFSKDAKNGFLFSRASLGGVLGGGVCFCVCVVGLAKRAYRRRRLVRFVYPCALVLGKRTVKADGFLDSGNRALFNGRPICFLSPDLAFDLLGEEVMREETEITTVGGRKKIKIFQVDRLEIYCGDEKNIINKVYCSPSTNIRARDYKIIFGADGLDGAL